MKHRFLKPSFLLLITISIITCIASVFFFASSREKSLTTVAITVEKTPRQWLEETVDCAALLATHESTVRGAMDNKTANLISYALGKAQEYALQAGLDKTEAKALYDQKTLAYFMAYTANAGLNIKLNHDKAFACQTSLSEYEPNAQIRNSINKAKHNLAPNPASNPR